MTQVIANRTDMYESHFGLKKRPFRALPAGNDVFVGPQAATTLAGLKKALSTPDAIVSVSGPIGVGKTTVVNRAANVVGEQRLIVSLGRIHLGHDDVLELLLEEMGADPIPASTVQRFTKFRRMLKQHSTKNTRVVIVVEDASMLGVDAIAELEALTATDAGVSDGANIVLMGEQMEDLLGATAMSRLQQRLRLRLSIQSLSSNELHGYLKHCFRLAGNDFDTLFEQGTSELLFTLSNGIPRIANNLVESALTTAAEDRMERVTVELLRVVAADEYGIDVGEPPAAVEVQPEPEPEPEPESEPALEPEPAPEPETASAAPDPVPQPVVDEEPDEDPIPELIQDTLPDLEILAPALANAPAPERSTAEIPAWERDPTLAQLRPDLDALEHAMAVAQGTETDGEEDVSQRSKSEEIPELVPEITLDKQIKAKIEEATEPLNQADEEAENKEDENDNNRENAAAEDESAGEQPTTPVVAASPEPAPSVTPPPVVQAPKPVTTPKPATTPQPPAETEKAEIAANEDEAELEKIAEDLSRAKTIDDVDDKMAETLFGEEFSDIAAQVAAKVAAELPANDELEPAGEELALAIPSPDLDGAAAISVDLEPELPPAPSVPAAGPEAAASQRLATVRALNDTPNVMPPQPPSAESIVIANDTAKPGSAAASNQPESIEHQMNTSITQTLKALNVRPAPGFVVEDYDDEKKGFFSRFRKP